MENKSITLTREQLYNEVWNKTLRKIYENLGVAYVELVRACNALNVPRPQPGYWESLRQGEKVEQVPLPERSAQTPRSISLRLANVALMSRHPG
jgi:hypothetical protein